MQFVANGPEIPNELLQAHEDGKVIFFCGAGISYPAGLPGFAGLVQSIYQSIGTDFSDIEKEAFEKQQFDATLDLLERRLPGQRSDVRRALAQSLKPNLRLKNATRTHEAILSLARTRTGVMRLVTTNFDRIFETAAKKLRLSFQDFCAPMLPIPKSSRWDGLVYLHGVLPKKLDFTILNRLVVTSGDFGLAYLTERWAARFVGELFRNYVVCFVGYSINDPVLRYMMDALAADRMLGEQTPAAWAFGDCSPGQEHKKKTEWEAKGVTPILYSVPAGTHDHSALHDSLHAWSETYRDGVTGKERIVVTHALASPSASTREDDFVGRMLWAISDKSGIPARRFAELEPVPPLNWLLECYAEQRFGHGDLERFGVTADRVVDTKLQFSLVNRPTRYSLAPYMDLRGSQGVSARLDPVMFQIARWLVRHLDDPRLAIWIARGGGRPHESFCLLIEEQLELISRLEKEGRSIEIENIRRHAPAAIPRLAMRAMWRVIVSGLVKGAGDDHHFYQWVERLKRDGLTTSLKLQFRSLIAPRVTVRESWGWARQLEGQDAESNKQVAKLDQILSWELVLATGHVYSFVGDFEGEQWEAALPVLLDDIQQCLRDALDLARELGASSDNFDRSFWDLPSIIPHWQNRSHHDWVSLIELLRDSWTSVNRIDSVRAASVAIGWFEVPYPTFKRLCFFAVSQGAEIPQDHWVSWLLRDGARWLWDAQTKREVLRLIVLQGAQLKGATKQAIETAVQAGPPREKYDAGLDQAVWEKYSDNDVWLYLSKLEESGLSLSSSVSTSLESLRKKYPEWRLGSHERDEFSHWMSGTGDPDYDENREINIAPSKRVELIGWLQQPVTPKWGFTEDTWAEVCKKHPANAGLALQDLAGQGVWPVTRWSEALRVWREGRFANRAWRYVATLAIQMPDSTLKDVAHSLSSWLENITKSPGRDDELLIGISWRIFGLFANDRPCDQDGLRQAQPLTQAINHPVGITTQALTNIWFSRKPRDNDNLPGDLKTLFTLLCDTRHLYFQHGRVILASNLIALYRVDPSWAELNLIPLLSWAASIQTAKALWEGFLRSPRLYAKLLIAIKPHLLEAAGHYNDLGESASQFSAFLTYVALGPVAGYEVEEFRIAVSRLPTDGLEQVARSLAQALGSTGEQREDYWRNRVEPFWRAIWPKSRELATENIGRSLALMCLGAGGEFPNAYELVKDWLLPIPHAHFITKTLLESGMCTRFPATALRFLASITGAEPWVARELEACLLELGAADWALHNDPEYRRLMEYYRLNRG